MSRAMDNPGADTIRELELLAPHAEFLLASSRFRPEEFSELGAGLGVHHRTARRYTDAKRVMTAAP